MVILSVRRSQLNLQLPCEAVRWSSRARSGPRRLPCASAHVGAATNPLHVVGKTEVDTRGNRATGRKLVIVESPAKAKTIAGYLGRDYDVEASVGHIRDLPNP